MRLRYFSLLPFLALYTGCWISPSEVSEKVQAYSNIPELIETADTSIPDKTVCSIGVVEPNFSTNGGGTAVSIAVTVEGEAPQVSIGLKPATIVSIEDGLIHILVPETKREGWTPITVETSEEYCALSSGIQLFEDGEGLTGASGVFQWHDYQGDYWVDGTSTGNAEFKFFRPVDFAYSDSWGTSMDSCVSEYKSEDTTAFEEYQPEAPAQLNGTSTSLAFAWQVKDNQYEGGLGEGDFEPSSSYSLRPIFTDGVWPRFDLDGFIETPALISITSPDVDGEFAPTQLSESVKLEWGGTNNGDYVVARVWRVVEGTAVEELRCLLNDDGKYMIGSSVWKSWSNTDQYLSIELGRVRLSEAILPYDLSSSGIVGIHWTHGAILTQ